MSLHCPHDLSHWILCSTGSVHAQDNRSGVDWYNSFSWEVIGIIFLRFLFYEVFMPFHTKNNNYNNNYIDIHSNAQTF